MSVVRVFCLLLALGPAWASAESRFPQPQFDSGHVVPQAAHPPSSLEHVPPLADTLALVLALAVAALLVHRVRSRRWLLVFTAGCLLWFGFLKRGCVCPVGVVQNVAEAVWAGGGLAWPVAALFALPLLAALLGGRLFCAAVCPLGAVQELVIIRPLRVPRALDAVLRLVPLAVLAFGTVLAVNGAGYWICRTDPFVGLFRCSAPLPMLLAGMAVVLLGMVVARPYCRYFCPYGVLLEVCARLAWRRVEITGSTCVNCRLCVGVCPVGAVAAPREALNEAARSRQFGHFLRILAVMPLLVAGGAGAGWLAGAALARAHPQVALAARLAAQGPATAAEAEAEGPAEAEAAPEIQAFRRSGRDRAEVASLSAALVLSFRRGSAWAGACIGLVVALRLLGLTRLSALSVHEADRVRCVACGRCFPACPKNRRPTA